jgi:hypothetical protein
LEVFLGSTELFTFAFVIILSYACAKFGMSNLVFGTILAISSIIMSVVLGQAIYVLILFIVGFLVFKSLGRILT